MYEIYMLLFDFFHGVGRYELFKYIEGSVERVTYSRLTEVRTSVIDLDRAEARAHTQTTPRPGTQRH